MNLRIARALVATVGVAMLCGAPLASFAKDPPKAATIVTVYVSGHGGGSIAEEMNKLHAKMEAEGWKFAAMELHHENGDTRGMWITYVK